MPNRTRPTLSPVYRPLSSAGRPIPTGARQISPTSQPTGPISDVRIPSTGADAGHQAAAERALRAGRYEAAVQSSVRAVAADPENGNLHLFQSLAFFAFGDYRSATDSIHRGLEVLDESEWGRVLENRDSFYRADAYQKQLAAVAQSAQRKPTQFHSQFLAGYHYLYLGDFETAHRFLVRSVELAPDDPLAERLLELTAEPLPPPPEAEAEDR